MKEYDFSRQMERLSSTFKSAYSTERVSILWKEVGALPADWFERQIDEWVGSLRQPPLLDEFREAASKERERAWSREKRQRHVESWQTSAWSCESCRDHGTYLCLRKGSSEGLCAFRCHCAKGAADPRKQIPQFKAEHVSDGFYWVDMSAIKIAAAARMVTT